MFTQVTLLTCIFVGWGVYVFVFTPLANLPPQARVEAPLDATESHLRQKLAEFVSAETASPGSQPPLMADPFIRSLVAANPDFRFYTRVGTRIASNGEDAFFRRYRIGEVEALHIRLNNPKVCSQATDIIADDGHGYLSFYMCDVLEYFEYRGLKRPILPRNGGGNDLLKKLLLPFSSNFLVAAGGVFLIFSLIFLAHVRSIRRVAALTHGIDPHRLDTQLPERGVATEILPLVRSVNTLIGQVEAAQRRATFFLSAAAHEMRTPLTVLRTRLELVDDDAIKDKLIADLRRLIDLVNGLLALTGIGNGRGSREPVDVVRCCRTAVGACAALAEARAVEIDLTLPDAGYVVEGDATLIASALSNLLRNAISFAPPETRVTIALSPDGLVTVRDHGPGIAPDRIEAVFEPFVRFPPNRKGHGLGLAIVKAVASVHDGWVSAGNAEEGGGAVFAIRFDPAAWEPRAVGH